MTDKSCWGTAFKFHQSQNHVCSVLPPLGNLRQKRENRKELVKKLGLAREDIRLQEGSHLFKSSLHYMDLNPIFSSIVDNSKFHKALAWITTLKATHIQGLNRAFHSFKLCYFLTTQVTQFREQEHLFMYQLVYFCYCSYYLNTYHI